jgi:hypothetical protein
MTTEKGTAFQETLNHGLLIQYFPYPAREIIPPDRLEANIYAQISLLGKRCLGNFAKFFGTFLAQN